MRRIGLSLALLFAFSPLAAAQSPEQAAAQPPATEAASAADVDRLLQAMDMKTMMAGMMQQIGAAQEKMVADAFGENLSEDDRKQMQEVIASTNVIVQKHMRWEALEPVVRKVYTQVFTQQEVQAMTAFYTSPEGASILRKSPQAMALTMQEVQPIATAAMGEAMAVLKKQIAARKNSAE